MNIESYNGRIGEILLQNRKASFWPDMTELFFYFRYMVMKICFVIATFPRRPTTQTVVKDFLI